MFLLGARHDRPSPAPPPYHPSLSVDHPPKQAKEIQHRLRPPNVRLLLLLHSTTRMPMAPLALPHSPRKAPRRAPRAVRPRAAAPLLLGVLAALCVAVLCSAASSSSGDPVYLLNTMYATDTINAKQANAVWLGIDAALYAVDYTTADGRSIEVFEVDSSSGVSMSNIISVVQEGYAMHPSMLGVIGPYSDATLATALNSAVLQTLGLMYMAPYTGSGAVRTWNNQVYFTRTEPRAELMAMLNYILVTLRARRTAFMYLRNYRFGDREYWTLVSTLSSMSLTPAALYSVPYSTTSTALSTTAFDAMANTYPQVVMVWGAPGPQTQSFLEALLTDPRTSSARIMACSAVQQLVFDVYYSLAAAGKLTPVAGQIMSSSTQLPITFPLAKHIAIFEQQMGQYIAKSGKVNATQWADEAAAVRTYGSAMSSSSSGSSDFFTEHPSASQLMLTGWLAGGLLVQTLNQPLWTVNAAAYQTGLFDQNRYIVGSDFVIGDYGGKCSAVAQLLGAVCSCNQGGHLAILQQLSNASWTVVTGSSFSYPQSVCYSTDVTLERPLNILAMSFTDIPLLEEIAVDITTTVPSAAATAEIYVSQANFVTLNVTLATAQTLLSAEFANYTVDVLTGPILRIADVSSTLVIAPVFIRPNLAVVAQNYLFLMPTLNQEMYVLYTKMSSVTAITSISSNVHLVLHGYDSSDVTSITATLSATAATFNLPEPTASSVANTTTVGSALVASSINYVLGVTVADVADICSFLTANTAAIVVISFADLSLYYGTLLPAFAALPASVQARLVSFSSLPLWSDTSAAAESDSALLAAFHAMLPNATNHTPALLRAVTAALAIQAMTNATSGVVNGTTLMQTAYLTGFFSAYDVSFGRFTWSCTTTTTGDTCTYKNYGAESIVMLSMQRMLDPSVPVTAAAVTPSMVYTAREPAGLTTAQRNGIIAGCIVGGLALIAAVALLVYCCTDSRDNDAAPKKPCDPVTLIFTDIESSTAMWAALPQLMADAIAAHHHLIRQLIKKHGCYEVKTIGDSFMIACSDVYSAVQLACEIQTKLLHYDWGTTEIDSKYREFELAKIDTADDYEPPTARLSEEVYDSLWRGLRVRIGLHTGLSDIRYDEVTKGYDYYGDTSNMAARTEAIANGGQVVATESTWWALSDPERATLKYVNTGAQGLRGVPFAVEMYQLDAVPGRTHAALRTEIEAILPDDGADETASSAADALLSSAGTMTGAAAGLAFSIASCFAPYPPAQRVREMQPLLARWSVGAPPRPPQVSEEDYCTALINRLAIRVGNIVAVQHRTRASLSADEALRGDGATHRLSNPLGFVTLQGLGASQHAPSPTSGAARPGLNASHMLGSGVGIESVNSTPARRRRSRSNSRVANNSHSHDTVLPFERRSASPVAMDDSGHVFGNRSATGPDTWRAGANANVRRRFSKVQI